MGFRMNEEKKTHRKKNVAQELLPHEMKQNETCLFCNEEGNEIIEILNLVEKLPKELNARTRKIKQKKKKHNIIYIT